MNRHYVVMKCKKGIAGAIKQPAKETVSFDFVTKLLLWQPAVAEGQQSDLCFSLTIFQMAA